MSKERKTNKADIKDTGLRGKFSGELYVDKSVFFQREDVKRLLKRLKESQFLKEQIEKSKQRV